jgi:hypothetical protein
MPSQAHEDIITACLRAFPGTRYQAFESDMRLLPGRPLGRSRIRFRPDGWRINETVRLLVFVEVEVTAPISVTKWRRVLRFWRRLCRSDWRLRLETIDCFGRIFVVDLPGVELYGRAARVPGRLVGCVPLGPPAVHRTSKPAKGSA